MSRSSDVPAGDETGSDGGHVIVGDGAAAVLAAISAELRERTLSRYGPRVGARDYSPWLACLPILEPTAVPASLFTTPYPRAGVISDQKLLDEIAEFLQREHELVLDQLIGDQEDWAIHTDVARVRPEMVAELDGLIAHVRANSPFFDRALPAVVEMIVPLRQPRARGLSTQLVRGAIFLGYPPGYDQTDFAFDLVHEMGHQALALLQSCDPLFASDPRALVYSEVRHTHRPAVQSLHAAAAIAFMLEYAKSAGVRDHVHPDFDVTLDVALGRAIDALREHSLFTALGEQVLRDLEALTVA